MSSSVNQVTIIGNLVKDPENRNEMVKLVIATNRTWTTREGEKKEDTEFNDVVCWSKVADIISGSRLEKGSKVYIQGYLKTREYFSESRERHFKTEIVAEKVVFL